MACMNRKHDYSNNKRIVLMWHVSITRRQIWTYPLKALVPNVFSSWPLKTNQFVLVEMFLLLSHSVNNLRSQIELAIVGVVTPSLEEDTERINNKY